MMVVKIMVFCTICDAAGEEVEGKVYEPIRLPGQRKDHKIELCADHAKTTLAPLYDALEEHGDSVDGKPNPTRQPGGTSSGMGDLACPVEGCRAPATFRYRSSVGSHVRSVHEQVLAEIERVNGVTIEGEPVIADCKHCPQGFATVQGLRTHESKSHGKAKGKAHTGAKTRSRARGKSTAA